MSRRLVMTLLLLSIATTVVSGEAYQRLSSRTYRFEGLEPGWSYRPSVVGGWPLPFLVDKISISPANRVSIVGGLVGADQFSLAFFAADIGIHFVVMLALAYAISRIIIRRRAGRR